MKKNLGSRILSAFLSTSLLGCAPTGAPAPSTPTPVQITPSDTPAPTAMPTTTSTVAPTATVQPPPVVTGLLSDVRLPFYDPFDDMGNWGWDSRTGFLNNGVFVMRGESFWSSSFSLNRKLMAGDGLLLRFKLKEANGHSEFVFVSGVWQTDSFRQFGIYNDRAPRADIFQGPRSLGGNKLPGSLTLKADTWYNLLMAIGKQGEFLAVMWEPGNESHRAVHHKAGGEKWSGRSWLFLPKGDEGETLYVDDFYAVSFGEIK